jgi:Ser/Thr protein kinase RdoA (MazF antagonist)
VRDELRDISEMHDEIIRTKPYKKLRNQIMNMLDDRFVSLLVEELPMVDATWDYKANNLVFVKDDFVLIDIDNAGRIPRILDLALALILFHDEIENIPPCVFSISQWEQFKKGYLEHVTLTEVEKRLWQSYVLFAYIDEALLTLANFDIHHTERQMLFIEDLLKFDTEKYPL